MEIDEGLTQALRAFERSATAATATVFLEFTRLRTDFKLKPLELFNLLGPPTRRTVALAQAAFQPLRTSIVQLEDSP
ncbi:hypothetical protein UCRNP2_6724 [Neofusicoccum parvum UCRNP2]|uniref:Uncharacterized protein n=1 Tax=Botryosphaeria parva (strain UCR-NP2) TaxID=1287680 RepID=R1EFL1_BOTPV|nr:hypothetical protein UCRNP2_6724 [Neofusicoccum parvum UCRNP2]